MDAQAILEQLQWMQVETMQRRRLTEREAATLQMAQDLADGRPTRVELETLQADIDFQFVEAMGNDE